MRIRKSAFFIATVIAILSTALFASAGSADLSRQEERVRKALVTLPYYSVFDNLAFQLDGSRVKLIGQVVRPTLKSDAEAAVRGVEGVVEVDNQIEVLPLSSNDDRIREATYRAIYGHPQFTKYAFRAVPPIHIIVKNGHVTLVGVVANQVDKNFAGVLGNGVAGAFSLTNNLQVER